MASVQKITAKHYLLTSNSTQLQPEWQWFDASFWQQQNAITGQSCGRSTTYFIAHNSYHFVLRHYYRGGMVRHFLRDAYFYNGIMQTRIYNELALLEQLNAWALPAPKPIAGRVMRSGLYYRADMLMEKIANAHDLYQILKERALTTAEWKITGATIAAFHQRGVYHADLNCHNIMQDERGKTWLIDFDRATLQSPESGRAGWTAQNLGRLYRSLTKEKQQNARFNFDDSHWEQLLAGYDSQN